MTFADIPTGMSLFIDANTLVYHFVPHPTYRTSCQQLLERVANQELVAFTSTHVLSDVAHRVMTLEAMARFGWPIAGIAQRLRKHLAEVQQLLQFRQAVDEVPQFRIQLLVPPPSIVSAAATVSQQHGLLSGDALIVALMRQFGITHLAIHDADFDRVPGLMRYAPQ